VLAATPPPGFPADVPRPPGELPGATGGGEARDHSPRRTFVAIAVAPRGVAPGRVVLAARLTGHGRGRACVTFAGARVCWRIRGLHGVGRPSGATIREGASGPVIVRLGRRFRASGCTTVPAGLEQAIAAQPGDFSVGVATRARPGGAVRGRLHRA
jgi:hypothetical protein